MLLGRPLAFEWARELARNQQNIEHLMQLDARLFLDFVYHYRGRRTAE